MKLLNPNKLLGLVDVEPGEKAKLTKVEAIEANKIERIRSNIFQIQLLFTQYSFSVITCLLFKVYSLRIDPLTSGMDLLYLVSS